MYENVVAARRQVNRQFGHWYPKLFICLLLVATIVGCSEGSTEADDGDVAMTAGAEAVPVRVASVSGEGARELLRFAGVSRPRQRANLSFQVGGSIEARFVEIGDRVEAGDIVARLYNPQLAPALQAAEARLQQLIADAEQTERDLQRLEAIYEQDLLAIQDLERQRTLLRNSRSAIDNARAIVAQNRQLQRESELRAPFSGHIETVLMEPGEFAQPGQPIMRMSAEGGLEVEVSVPPHLLSGLAVGQKVPVWHGLSEMKFTGRITEIGEGNSGISALYPVVVSVQDSGLRSGEALEVGVSRIQPGRLTVPLSAILRSAQGLAVFQVTDERARRVPVRVAQITGDRVILETGSLSAGDRVVYAGLTRLADGDPVELLNGSAAIGAAP